MSNISELGQLIDCEEKEFREYCKDKDVGYLSGFHNLLVQTFNQTQDIKDELVSKMSKTEKESDEYKSCQSILEGLYSKLMRIEQRVFILREEIDARKIIPKSTTD